MSIKIKVFVAMALLGLTMATMFFVTFAFTRVMSNDAVSINLGGRQRMLIQKIGKELLVLHGGAGQDTGAKKAMVQNSLALFERTLVAMRSGGEAPSTLQADGPTVRLAPATGAAAQELKSGAPWFAAFMELGRKAAEGDAEALKRYLDQDAEALRSMSRIVASQQAEAEGKVSALLLSQLAALALGGLVLLLVLVMFQRDIISVLLRICTLRATVFLRKRRAAPCSATRACAWR